MKFFHDNEDLLWSLKHTFQINDAGVVEFLSGRRTCPLFIRALSTGHSWRRSDVFYLENCHLVPQLTLLLGWKSHLINDFDCHISATLSVFTCTKMFV